MCVCAGGVLRCGKLPREQWGLQMLMILMGFKDQSRRPK